MLAVVQILFDDHFRKNCSPLTCNYTHLGSILIENNYETINMCCMIKIKQQQKLKIEKKNYECFSCLNVYHTLYEICLKDKGHPLPSLPLPLPLRLCLITLPFNVILLEPYTLLYYTIHTHTYVNI